MLRLRSFASFACVIAAALAATSARAASADDEAVTEPDVRPTWLWLATQLVPSPEAVYGESTSRFGARWQVTPVLYSWGINRKLSPWRILVAEPLTRQSGSIELFFSPEYVMYGSRFTDGLVWRTGVRSYFPIIERGDYLSVSAGASHFTLGDRNGAAIEAGAYVLYGTVGAQLTWSPSIAPMRWIATFRVRVF